MKNQAIHQAEQELERCQELLDDLNKVAEASNQGAVTAAEYDFDYTHLSTAPIKLSVEKMEVPVNTKELAADAKMLGSFQERSASLDDVIEKLKGDPTGDELSKQAEDMKKKLQAAYTKAKKALHDRAASGAPKKLSSFVEDAVKYLKTKYAFKGKPETTMYVWFNDNEQPFYGASLTVSDLSAKETDHVTHDDYTICFAMQVLDTGNVALYVRGDPAKTMPMKGKYGSANRVASIAALHKVIQQELDLDDIAKNLSKLPLDSVKDADMEALKGSRDVIDSVSKPHKDTLQVIVNIPFAKKEAVKEEAAEIRYELLKVLGFGVQNTAAVSLEITKVAKNPKQSAISLQLIKKPNLSGNRMKDLRNRLRILRHELELSDAEYALMQKFIYDSF